MYDDVDKRQGWPAERVGTYEMYRRIEEVGRKKRDELQAGNLDRNAQAKVDIDRDNRRYGGIESSQSSRHLHRDVVTVVRESGGKSTGRRHAAALNDVHQPSSTRLDVVCRLPCSAYCEVRTDYHLHSPVEYLRQPRTFERRCVCFEHPHANRQAFVDLRRYGNR